MESLEERLARRARERRKLADFSDVTSGASSGTDDLETRLSRRAREIGYGKDQPRGVVAGLKDVGEAFRHPVKTAKGMAEGIAEGLNKAGSPVEGMPKNIVGNLVRGRRQERVTRENTRNAVTPKEFARGAFDSAINIGFAVAPALSLPLRAGSNAALGALHLPEDRLRGATAGLALGEVLHGASRTPGAIRRATDVSEGMMEAAASDMARTTRGTSPPELMADHTPEPMTAEAIALVRADQQAGRRGRLPDPVIIQPARGKLPKEAASTTKAGLVTESGGFRARAPRSLEEIGVEVDAPPLVDASGSPVRAKVNPRSFDDAFDVTGARRRVALPEEGVRRRPAVDEPHALPEEDAQFLDTEAQLGGIELPESRLPDPGRVRGAPGEMRPVAVATPEGELVTRPGTIGRVNRELAGKGPTSTAAPLPRIRPDDIDRPPPEPMISVAEATRRIEEAKKRAETAVPREPLEPKEVQKTSEGYYISARAPGGTLRDVATVSDDGLIREMLAIGDRMSDAARRAEYHRTFDDDVSAMVTVAGKRDKSGVSPQAKALQNIKDMERVQARIDAELRRRGYDDETIGSKMAEHYDDEQLLIREADALRERQTETAAPDETIETPRAAEPPGDIDTSFDFGANVGDESFRVQARSRPREFLNWAKANYNQTVEARIRQAVARGEVTGEIRKGYQSFEEQSYQAQAYKERVAKELLEDPLSIDRKKMERLTGAEIEGLKLLVGENAATMEAASRILNDPAASPADLAQATELFDLASSTTDQALSKIVSETAQTARSLGYMRNMAKHSLDPEVWLVQAKRMLGDEPMTDTTMIEIRRLAREAAEACG